MSWKIGYKAKLSKLELFGNRSHLCQVPARCTLHVVPQNTVTTTTLSSIATTTVSSSSAVSRPSTRHLSPSEGRQLEGLFNTANTSARRTPRAGIRSKSACVVYLTLRCHASRRISSWASSAVLEPPISSQVWRLLTKSQHGLSTYVYLARGACQILSIPASSEALPHLLPPLRALLLIQ